MFADGLSFSTYKVDFDIFLLLSFCSQSADQAILFSQLAFLCISDLNVHVYIYIHTYITAQYMQMNSIHR